MKPWIWLPSVFLLCACEGSTIASANIAIATVPCALLWLTLNIGKG